MISSTRSHQEETITSRRSLREELHGHERRRSFFDNSRWKRELRIESRTHLADINPTAHYRRVCHRVARAWCDGGEMPKKVSATGVLDPQQFRFRKRVWAVGEVATLTLQTGRCWKLKNWSPGDCGGQAICHDAVQLGTSCQAASLRRRNLLRVLNVVTREFLISVELFPGRRKESVGGFEMEIFEFLDWQGVTPKKELGVVVHVLYLL